MNLPGALVCVVDDEPSIRRSLVRVLGGVNLVAEAFDSARAYLERARHDGPMCLVLDVRMPELTGLDLQNSLLARGGHEEVVFMTGSGDIPTSVQAMKAGAVDFLSKPFKELEFLAAVNRALLRSSERRARDLETVAARKCLAALTPREHQVLQGVMAGKLNKQIASELGTALPTVKVQRGNLMKKMEVISVADLVKKARKAAPETY